MVEAPQYVIYSNTPPHMKVLWVRSVEYFILIEWGLRFELITDCHFSSDTMLRNQLNQKLKPMVRSQNMLYTLTPTSLKAHKNSQNSNYILKQANSQQPTTQTKRIVKQEINIPMAQ